MNENYSNLDDRFPVGICNTCRITLNEHEKEISIRPIPIMPNYENLVLRKETRQNNNNTDCNCYICETARVILKPSTILGSILINSY